MSLQVLGISGGVGAPSHTTTVVAALLAEIARLTGTSPGLIEIRDASRHLFRGLARGELDAAGEAIIARVEAAELLVVGTPVYRASLTGALKHLFDLVDYRALTGRAVLLAATGGGAQHSLVVEHQLRPLFGFFGALTVPTAIYTVPGDFAGADIANPALRERIAQAAAEAVALAEAGKRRTPQDAAAELAAQP